MTVLVDECERAAVPGQGVRQLWPAGAATIVFALLSLAAGAASEGFLEADGCTHYLYARFALSEPHFLVNVWGRPLFTALYALPAAYAGLIGAHLLSLVLAIACGFLAMTIARGQQYRWPAVALIFTLAQPLVFLHSFSELTELPFAALVGLMLLAYQRRQWLLMAILAGLAPLGRPEGFGFILLAGAALVEQRRWRWLVVLVIPLLLWNHAGWLLSGASGPWWRWLPDNWPYTHDSLYPSGNLLHFVALLPAVTSPFIFPATCVGIWQSWVARLADAHRARCQQLIAIIPLLILGGHSLLYATGKLASSGELRYMLVVAPLWGLLGARGWEWFFTRFDWRWPLRWAGAAALAGGLANAVYPVVPLQPKPDEDFAEARRFVWWYRASHLVDQYDRMCTAQMFVYFHLDVSPTDRARAMEYRRDLIQRPPPRTIIVWDPVYSVYNADERRSIPLEELLEAGWMEIDAPPANVGEGWRVLVSEPPRAAPDAGARRSLPR